MLGKKIRSDFPIFSRKINGKRLAYLDNAATTQKPKPVLEAIVENYKCHNANPGRGISKLSAESEEIYQKARERIASFLKAKPSEIVFTKNATESLNLLSYALESKLAGERRRPIAISLLEHHSNFVPWQQMAKRAKRKLAFIPFDASSKITQANLAALETSAPPVMATLTHASNVLGTINEIEEIAKYAHQEWDCPLVVDAAQTAPHIPIDVRKLGCDFLAFSGHKMLGPMGIGVLYIKEDWIERLPPFMTGGGQISKVGNFSSAWAEGVQKFEAGTQNVGGAVGLAAAIDYIKKIGGLEKIAAHENKLVKKTLEMLNDIGDIEVYGLPSEKERVGVISFNLKNAHSHDVGFILDKHGVQVRVGHHCAQPLMRKLGISSTVRVSFYIYNDFDDIIALENGLKEAQKIFGA